VPGASEWGSLARVRRGVRKLQRRTAPGGPNNDNCCGTCCRRASTSGRWAKAASGAGDVRAAPDLEMSGADAKAEVNMAAPRQDQSVAPGAQSGRRTMCSTLAPVPSSSRQPQARASTARCGTAAMPRRSSDDAPPWQRGPAGRRGETAEAIGRRGDMTDLRCSCDADISLQHRARGEEAQRPCQAKRAMKTPQPPATPRRQRRRP